MPKTVRIPAYENIFCAALSGGRKGAARTIPIESDDRLTELAGGATGLEVNATSVHGALIQVAKAHPKFRMFNCDGELRSILRVHCKGAPAAIGDTLAKGDALRLSLG